MTARVAHRVLNSNFIQTLPKGITLVEYGPMRMTIHASEQGVPLPNLAEDGALLATGLLEDLSKHLAILKRESATLGMGRLYPDVVRRMIEATRVMGEPDLTPLASVAGSISEVVADFIFSQGGTKVIVENGGDLAIRLREGEVARVGIKTEIDSEKPAYLLSLDSGMEIGGVATSGLGGRSFTKGIASAVTVLAHKASLADSAATVIGNFTNTDDPQITRTLAERIYPDTDIAGEWVTVKVGALSPQRIEEALNNGMSKANSLTKQGLIKGALIAVQGRVLWTDSLNGWLRKI